MQCIPHELQVKIIKEIPKNNWFKVLGIPFLECGIQDKDLWKECNANEFGQLCDLNIELFKQLGHLVEKLQLLNDCWDSSKITEVVHFFSGLCELDCSSNDKLQDLTFICYVNLTRLDVHGCFRIRRLNLLTSVRSCTNLKYLDISDCDQVREKDILRIAKVLKQLQIFNVRDTCSLKRSTVLDVRIALKDLKQLLFCPLVYASDTTEWITIYMDYPILQICPAGLEIIMESNPHILQ